MSNELTADIKFSIVPEWILDAGLSDRAVRVYALLARYADNETLQAFPSRETLAKRAGCHWRSIDRAIEELVNIGAIIKRHRKSDKSYQSNLYTLRRIPPSMSGGTDTPVSRVLTQQSVGTDTGGNLTRTTELEPLNDIFARFWDLYPRKVGKEATRKALDKALREYDSNVILEGLERMVADPNLPEKQFLPHPATWLNQGRWEDEPYPTRVVDGRPVKPAAEGPGKGTWKVWYHEQDDHTFCRPGEFDH